MDKLTAIARRDPVAFIDWLNHPITEALMYDINKMVIERGIRILSKSSTTIEEDRQKENDINYRKGQESILTGVLIIKESFDKKPEDTIDEQ